MSSGRRDPEQLVYEFHDIVLACIDGITRCIARDPENPAWHWDCVGASRHALAVGVYAYQLAWLMDVVGARERVFVSRLEDIGEEETTVALVEGWARHVGLDSDPKALAKGRRRVQRKLTTGKRANENKHTKRDMLPETRAILQEYFAPYNDMLVELLGDEGFRYKYSKNKEPTQFAAGTKHF